MSQKPRIVVLDGSPLNPGDLSWSGLEALGDCTIYEHSPAGEIAARAAGADLVLTNKAPLSAETIAQLDQLRYIGVLATGYNIVDVGAAREREIAVANVPTYGTLSVAQMVFAHILNHTQHVAAHAESVARGGWTEHGTWCYWTTPLAELEGQTLGIIGLGRIGSATARIGQAFGMSVLAYNHRPKETPDGVRLVDLPELLSRSDVVSLHCPLTDETREIINAERLAMMKPSALLINTSRGPLIDEHALADALNNEEIAGAGLDVLSSEPPDAANPLLTAKHCHITPHIAWATRGARQRLLQTAVDNAAAFLSGNPQNLVH